MLNAREFEILGKEVFRRNPGLAREIIQELNIYPEVKDLSRLPELALDFCKVQKMDPGDLSRKSTKAVTVRQKTLFCAVAVMLFQPDNLKNQKQKNRYGFRTLVAKELDTSRISALSLISKGRFYYKHYREFREEVESIYLKLAEKYVAGNN